MRTMKVRNQDFNRLSVKTCRLLFKHIAGIRQLCVYWYDGPVEELLAQPQMLRRLVIRALREHSVTDVSHASDIPATLCSYGGTSVTE